MKSYLLLCLFVIAPCFSNEPALCWWHSSEGVNFGDDLSRVIVEKILDRSVRFQSLESKEKKVLAVGSILHYAGLDDIIWGSGFRDNPLEEKRLTRLDVRAVRGPRTRQFLLQMGIPCPKVYGDPAILMGRLFPEIKKKAPKYDYIIIPNIADMSSFRPYKNVVAPTTPWREIADMMVQSRLVISSSLHGIIMAEAFGVPARLVKMTWVEPLLKYQDYYEATGRPDFRYATSVQEALEMGGEKPRKIDIEPLLNAFPWDHFGTKSHE